MTKYRIYLVTTASTIVEVEADDPEAAIEAAFEGDLPHAPGFADYEFGEWTTPSELFPQFNKPEEDWEEVAS